MRAVMIVLATLASGLAMAEPQAKFSGNTPISVHGLVDEDGCIPAKISGRVVKRSFADNGITITTFIVEERTGERTLVNVDDEKVKNASMAARSNAMRAMQIILREGARVNLGVFACGAAGRVLMLESARATR